MTQTSSTKLTVRKPFEPASLPKTEVATLAGAGFTSITFIGTLVHIPHKSSLSDRILPIMPSVTSDWNPKTAAQADRLSPLFPVGLLFRVWCETKADAKRLLNELPAFLHDKGAIKLRGEWWGFATDIDCELLQLELQETAAMRGITVLDDDDVLKRIRKQEAQAA